MIEKFIDNLLDKYYSRKLIKILSNNINFNYDDFITKSIIDKNDIFLYIKKCKEKDKYFILLYRTPIFSSFTDLMKISTVIKKIYKRIEELYY